MRKSLLGLALLTTTGIAHAESNENQLFDCMDRTTFEVNSECMSNQITSNIRFKEAEQKVVNMASESRGDYAIATMTFDPRKMQIDIVAHRDALQAMNRVSTKN
ncbi:pyridine nucleotide transhydrogenase [Salinimonas iocasae]|uniref:Pyridine nucleotide transhydrogenase n=1 Tax=Salinimonas iocasae TaxID=2572577 RepID=A0A5B7YB75_9ALTE|nr:pyridine nucleotide transhydrogenase [Salinimonas iocasae]QCZ92543.1 pyridine nucleotide transhydrogenase [Salinimonas iocasae]